MIVEYIRYKLQPADTASAGQTAAEFEAAYRGACASLDISPHCLTYELSRCVEEADHYLLRIEWDSAEGHLNGFRRAPEFAPFLAAIRPYVSQIQEMRHYAPVRIGSGAHTKDGAPA